MSWGEVVTLVAAVVAAVAAVWGVVLTYWRGRFVLLVEPRVERSRQGVLELFVDLVNAGSDAVSVEKVFLAGGGAQEPGAWDGLKDRFWHPGFPIDIPKGKKRAIGPVHDVALKGVLVQKPLTVVAKTEDGRRVQTRCPGLRQIYLELEAAAAAENAAQP